MAQFRVVILKHGYPSSQTEQRIIENAGGECLDLSHLSDAEGIQQCTSADAILVRWLAITRDIIQRLERCRIIVRYGVGTDNVDVAAATERGILVGHVPDYCIDEVSTHAIAMLLDCVRNLTLKHLKMRDGVWEVNPLDAIYRVAGKTLGLVGFGHIGQAVARKLGGWNLRILAVDPFVPRERAAELGVELVDLETLCRHSDFISLHVPLLPETRHLIGAREFRWMKRGVILVNTARGPVLDTSAALEALENGRISRLALDVFETEPLPPEHPFRRHSRVVVSDHAAWYSEEAQEELKITAAEDVVRVCTGGLPRSVANPELIRQMGRFDEWSPSDTVKWQLKRLESMRRMVPGARK